MRLVLLQITNWFKTGHGELPLIFEEPFSDDVCNALFGVIIDFMREEKEEKMIDETLDRHIPVSEERKKSDLEYLNAIRKKLVKNQDSKVSHPSHYTWLKELCGIEVIDITRHMDFDLGNCVKYLLRAGHKKEEGYTDKEKALEDLKKAAWYLDDKIKMLENEQELYRN